MTKSVQAEELLAGAREDLRRGFAVRAGTRLRQAAAAGHAEAPCLFATVLLKGQIPGRAREARTTLETGNAPLAPTARMLRATLRYAGIGGEVRSGPALTDLNQAAEAGHPPALIESALLWLEQGGERAVRAARTCLLRAADSSPPAQELLALLPESRTPGVARLPALAAWPAARQPQASERLCRAPRIERFRGAFTPLECAWLWALARPQLAPSLIVDPRSGRPRPDPTRTGETMHFDFSTASICIYRMAARMASLAGYEAACAEPLAVLRYAPGQQYKPHYDSLGAAGLARDPLRAAGDRAATVLGYLNVPEAGGATLFTRLGVRVEPALGDVLAFSNVDADGQPEQDSQHAGEPVETGEKWLASLWVRQRPVRF